MSGLVADLAPHQSVYFYIVYWKKFYIWKIGIMYFTAYAFVYIQIPWDKDFVKLDIFSKYAKIIIVISYI